jgi:hypothetical protein
MGVFSKCCAKTHLPVLSGSAWGRDVPRLTRIVVLLRGEKPFTAEYDGYGLHLDDDFDDAKFVLEDVYKGERWEDLPESGYEPNQGFFHDKQLMLAIAALPNGFATWDDYVDVLREYEDGSEKALATAFSKLDIPPPETLYVNMLEYLHYVVDERWESAQFYVERHPDVLDWLPDDQPGKLAQAKVFTQALDEETRAQAARVLADYLARTPA